ncbi:MAG: hypothetical protein LQ347_001333 [Umbilicaria vellea]|nr:MAG: hypothetical protein LQ347_001333 [Umbilicaria vellea]
MAVANATGVHSSGTKPILSARLLEDLQLDRFSSPQVRKDGGRKIHRVISIDMGIRNLAYCRLAFPDNWTTGAKASPPVLEDWARIVISRKATSEDLPSSSPASKVKEAFDPATYSQYAYNLVSTLLASPSPPTQILIERQRFRSMGGSSVQEWTLRVNMFEAMIYAVLKAFQSQNLWTGTVHPVAPGKVANFWLDDSDLKHSSPAAQALAIKPAKSKSANTKTAKIDLVARWLEDGSHFALEGRTADLGRAYLQKRQGRKRVMTEEKELRGSADTAIVPAEMGKLDDLADCLLQGMAWIKWEENRRGVLKGGLDALWTPPGKIEPTRELARGVPKNAKGVVEAVAPVKKGRKKRVGES